MITKTESEPKKRGRPKGSISKPRLPKRGRPRRTVEEKLKMKPIPAPKIERHLADPTELFCVRVPVKQSIRARLHRLALLMRSEGEVKTTASDLARAMLQERVTAMETDWLKKIRDDLAENAR